MFRELSTEEEQEFRRWARENFTPGDDIDPLWHPIVRNECLQMEMEKPEMAYYRRGWLNEKKAHARSIRIIACTQLVAQHFDVRNL